MVLSGAMTCGEGKSGNAFRPNRGVTKGFPLKLIKFWWFSIETIATLGGFRKGNGGNLVEG